MGMTEAADQTAKNFAKTQERSYRNKSTINSKLNLLTGTSLAWKLLTVFPVAAHCNS